MNYHIYSNYFSDSVPVSGTSASLLLIVWARCRFPSILRVSKSKCSCSSYEPESLEALDFKRLLFLRTSLTALDTKAFSYLPLARSFLAPWKLTRTAPPMREVKQVDQIIFRGTKDEVRIE